MHVELDDRIILRGITLAPNTTLTKEEVMDEIYRVISNLNGSGDYDILDLYTEDK